MANFPLYSTFYFLPPRPQPKGDTLTAYAQPTTKPAKGDTVTITATVTSVDPNGSTELRTVGGKWYFRVDQYTVEDLKVTKKATPEQPKAGSVVKAVTKYGSQYKYLIRTNGALYAILSDGSVEGGSYLNWSTINHGDYTITTF